MTDPKCPQTRAAGAGPDPLQHIKKPLKLAKLKNIRDGGGEVPG